MKRVCLTLLLSLVCDVCSAQFLGNAFWNTLPTSGMGTAANGLTITDLPNGFEVTGQVTITLTGPASGLLAHWVVDRPLDPGFTGTNLTTVTVLDGFSAPAPGGAGNSTGHVTSIFTDYLGTTTSLSTVPMTLVNGVDVPAWNNLTSTSALFNHTGSPGQFLRQSFWLDGVYTGAGGAWVIDVPVFSLIVPEPSSVAMLGTALVCVGAWWTRRRFA